MLRIAVVSPLFPTSSQPYRGAPIYRTVLALQRWAEVQVLCPLPAFPDFPIFHSRSLTYQEVDPEYSPPGMRTQYVPYPAFPVLSRLFNGRSCMRSLLPYLETIHPDIILAYWIYPEGYGALASGEHLNIPVIVGARGSDLKQVTDPFTHYMVRLTLRRASFVLTVSEDLRRKALRLGASPERVQTLPNGCDSSVFRLADSPSARLELGVKPATQVILFVGWLGPIKGVDELVDAAALLEFARPSG